MTNLVDQLLDIVRQYVQKTESLEEESKRREDVRKLKRAIEKYEEESEEEEGETRKGESSFIKNLRRVRREELKRLRYIKVPKGEDEEEEEEENFEDRTFLTEGKKYDEEEEEEEEMEEPSSGLEQWTVFNPAWASESNDLIVASAVELAQLFARRSQI